ncbi:hypothetical protein PVAP13_9NG074573 [Panicum virgatum]|uniref:Uncharacterized protein n=1 Tax=Panicum virgatum TaxID=38727 RepID=A0A8T0MFL1_PANVG|nr:hypothetical protein PVAP13_9NG074573 [Panicum virgatum]
MFGLSVEHAGGIVAPREGVIDLPVSRCPRTPSMQSAATAFSVCTGYMSDDVAVVGLVGEAVLQFPAALLVSKSRRRRRRAARRVQGPVCAAEQGVHGRRQGGPDDLYVRHARAICRYI